MDDKIAELRLRFCGSERRAAQCYRDFDEYERITRMYAWRQRDLHEYTTAICLDEVLKR